MITGTFVYAYRMAGSRTYHIAREDYIRTGLAECGFSIGRAGFTARQGDVEHLRRTVEHYGKKLCGHCAKRA